MRHFIALCLQQADWFNLPWVQATPELILDPAHCRLSGLTLLVPHWVLADPLATYSPIHMGAHIPLWTPCDKPDKEEILPIRS